MTDTVDTYTAERAGFAERAGKLAGSTTYREPVAGRTNKADHMPDAHAIAAAFAFARVGPKDIGPDIAVAIITGTTAHRVKIVRELASALLVGLGRSGDRYVEAMIEIAADCYLRVVTGRGIGKPDGMPERAYEIARSIGDRILWVAADNALLFAERAYRRVA